MSAMSSVTSGEATSPRLSSGVNGYAPSSVFRRTGAEDMQVSLIVGGPHHKGESRRKEVFTFALPSEEFLQHEVLQAGVVARAGGQGDDAAQALGFPGEFVRLVAADDG